MSRFQVVSVALTPLLIVILSGCRDREIVSYRVKREVVHPPATASAVEPAGPKAQVPEAPSSMASTPVPTAQGDGLQWTAPAHWTSKPASAMRRATYAIPGGNGSHGELAVTAFPGNVGGNLANVNRWRGQIQLEPVGAQELEKLLEHLDAGSLHIDLVDIKADTGADPQRIIGAIVPLDGSTWFFKFSGPDSLLTAEKSAIIGFLRTIRPSKP